MTSLTPPWHRPLHQYVLRHPPSLRYQKPRRSPVSMTPVALPPIIMKTLKRVVMSHMKNTINITSDCHQYAYRQNQSTADAVSAIIHQDFPHLETSNSYARLLFLDFSSAYNHSVDTDQQAVSTRFLSITLHIFFFSITTKYRFIAQP